jgi:von Willebrand factor A domain-containing protein 8
VTSFGVVQVVVVLKGLVEDGFMRLSDGRLLMVNPPPDAPDNIVPIHPNFRMFLLANRPGFPFLGNDLMRFESCTERPGPLQLQFVSVVVRLHRECGDVFSCHVIGNPDVDSLQDLMGRYGPKVPKSLLATLADSVTVRNVSFLCW